MSIKNRLVKLEAATQAANAALHDRIAWVMNNPGSVAPEIYSRITEILENAKQRRDAQLWHETFTDEEHRQMEAGNFDAALVEKLENMPDGLKPLLNELTDALEKALGM